MLTKAGFMPVFISVCVGNDCLKVSNCSFVMIFFILLPITSVNITMFPSYKRYIEKKKRSKNTLSLKWGSMKANHQM